MIDIILIILLVICISWGIYLISIVNEIYKDNPNNYQDYTLINHYIYKNDEVYQCQTFSKGCTPIIYCFILINKRNPYNIQYIESFDKSLCYNTDKYHIEYLGEL